MKIKSDKKVKRAAKFMVATAGAFALISCSNSPSHRIAECLATGQSEADCNAAEFAWEKAHPLPVYDTGSMDTAAALQAAFNQSASRKPTK